MFRLLVGLAMFFGFASVAQAQCGDSVCNAISTILNDRSAAFADLRAGAPDGTMGASDGTVAITINGYSCQGRVVANDSMADNNGSDYRCIYGVPSDAAGAVFRGLRAGAQEAIPSSWDQWNDNSDGEVWCAGPDDAHTLVVVDHFGNLVKLWVFAQPQLRANGFCGDS